MATKSIGSGTRDYATIALWESYVDALGSLSAPEIGECYNDSEFHVAGGVVVFSGIDASAANYCLLRPAAGQGFKDHADVQTNPLKYDASKGVALRSSTNYVKTVDIAANYVRLEGLQMQGSGALSDVVLNVGAHAGIDVNACILENASSYARVARLDTASAYVMLRNSLFLLTHTTNVVSIAAIFSGVGVVNCTFAKPADAALKAISGLNISYSASALKNVAIFGCTDDISTSSGGSASATTCATDDTSPTTGFTGSLTFADQFENVLNATKDFRLKTGADLIDVGTTDATNAANDIVGTARPQGAAYDIGCWELVVGGGGGTTVARLVNGGLLYGGILIGGRHARAAA